MSTPLFLLGQWEGTGKVFSSTDRLKEKIFYIEELSITQGFTNGPYWYRSQTWQYDPNDPERKKIRPLHVESGVLKVLPDACEISSNLIPSNGTPLSGYGEKLISKDGMTKIEGSFIHPFSVSEIAVGFCNMKKENTKMQLFASLEAGSFLRGPGSKGKKLVRFERVYELTEKNTIVYKCALQSEGMDEIMEHLECELKRK